MAGHFLINVGGKAHCILLPNCLLMLDVDLQRALAGCVHEELGTNFKSDLTYSESENLSCFWLLAQPKIAERKPT